jgi:hypothetical protein
MPEVLGLNGEMSSQAAQYFYFVLAIPAS